MSPTARKDKTSRHGYKSGDKESLRKYLRANITNPAVARMKLLAGAPRISMTQPEGVKGTTASEEVRALYLAIVRVLVRDAAMVLKSGRDDAKTLKLHTFQTALKMARNWRYYR